MISPSMIAGQVFSHSYPSGSTAVAGAALSVSARNGSALRSAGMSHGAHMRRTRLNDGHWRRTSLGQRAYLKTYRFFLRDRGLSQNSLEPV
jgi:hypothetical protein